MRIIAFDSSLARSAFAAYDGEEYQWEARSFIKPRDKNFPDARFADWREWAAEILDNVFDLDAPDLVIYEKPTTLGQGSGAPQIMLEMTLRELCAVRKIPVRHIMPSHLKKAVTGSGKAEKQDMQRAVAARVPEYSGTEDAGGDIADSLAMILWFMDGAPESDAAKAKAKRKARKVVIA